MIDDLLYEIIKLKWVAIISVLLIVIASIVFWIFSRNFNFKKSKMQLFSTLYKLDIKQVVCVALIIGRLLFTLTSIIFCLDINIGHLVIFILFTVMILIFSKNLKLFLTSLFNYFAMFLLIFIESTLFKYYFDVEKMLFVVIMGVMIGIFVLLDTLLSSLNAYDEIVKKEVRNA